MQNRVRKHTRKIRSSVLRILRASLHGIKNNAGFLIADVTAIALIWQTCSLNKSVELYKSELQSEQKPIILHMLGYSEPIRLQDSCLIATELLQNIGKMPAYNLQWHHAIRNDSLYPVKHFDELISLSAPSRNILNPGIPILDEIRITFASNQEWTSTKELAYYMYENEIVTYMHYCIYYNDIADRSYILRETFGLYGASDSTFKWHQEYATETEQEAVPE